MGRLILRAGERVYLDTSILVYLVERHPVYFDLVAPLWEAAQSSGISCFTSELSILEALVMPVRNADKPLIERYERAFSEGDLTLTPIDPAVLRRAAALRASNRPLKTPDAIHIASAAESNCSLFLTNDEKLRWVSELTVVIVRDLLIS